MNTAASRSRLRYVVATAFLAALGTLGNALVAGAQSTPTPEGTVITNTATVNYTDANGNTYTAETASVSVTVGFKAGIDVTAGAATVTPASPSTGNTMAFTLTNTGNGPDTMQVLTVNSSTLGVITPTGYSYNGTTYPTLAALNAVLATVSVPAGGSIVVTVVYDVPTGQGGQTTTVTLTANEQRATLSDSASTDVKPPLTGSVAVTPDGGLNLMKLPTSGETYTQTFTVTNNETAADIYGLVATSPAGSANITIVSVGGTAGTTFTMSSLAAGASTTIDVVYTITGTAGAKDTIVLTATSTDPARSTVTDPGFADVQLIQPALAMTKAAYRSDQSTLLGAGDKVLPGETIWYKITVTNNGTAEAQNVVITDNLPAELTWVQSVQDAPTWNFGSPGNNVTATLSGTLAASASRYIWIQATVK